MTSMTNGPGTPMTYRAALEALTAAQKPSAGTPLYSRYVNRPVGRRFAAFAASVGLSPNTVSLISAGCSFAAIAVIAFVPAGHVAAVAAALLLVVGYALDSADGQVARLTGTGSVLGEWLDHMLDCAKISSLHVAVAWHVLHRDDVSERWVIVPMLFVVVAAVMFFGMILTDQLRRAAGQDRGTSNVRPDSVLRSLAVLPSDYGLLCLTFVLLGTGEPFLGIYAVLLVCNAGLLAAALTRWVRILQGIGRSAPG